ncbi:hypothetical protein Tco_0688924 [Tanacetum coccineum]
MASDSSSQTQPKQLNPAQNVHFQLEDCIIKFNNGVALMESNDDAYKLLLLFLKNSCIFVALTKQPSAYYPKYLREFWYTAEADMASKSITFTLSHFDKPLSFDLDTFSSIIWLKCSDECVLVPPKETVKAGLATLGLVDDEHPSLHPLISSTHLWEVNADDTADKSLSDTFVQLVTQPKALTTKRPRKKKIPSSTQLESLDASESAEVQGNQPETTDAKKVLDQNIMEEKDARVQSLDEPILEQLIDKVYKQNKAAQEIPESPYDTESEIKYVKSFNTTWSIHPEFYQTDDVNVTFIGSGIDIELNDSGSDLHSMPSDDLASLTVFETPDSNTEESNSVTKELTADNLNATSDGDAALPNAFVGVSVLSDPLGHLQRELATISSKIGKKVKAKVRTGMRYATERLDSLHSSLIDNFDRVSDLSQGLKTMNFLLKAAEVFKKANAEGEKWEKNNPETPKDAEGEQSNAQDFKETALIIHHSEKKNLEDVLSENKDSDEEPSIKKLKVMIPTPEILMPTPLSSLILEH